MKDKFGHQRGACSNCQDCPEFLSTEGEVRCTRCGCVPVAHEKIITVTIEEREEEEIDIMEDQQPSTTHLVVPPIIKPQKDIVPAVTCRQPGCSNNVDFNINTGHQYTYCSEHNNDDGIVMIDLTTDEEQYLVPFNNIRESPEVMIVDDDNDHTNLFQQQIPVVLVKCALAECTNSCYINESGFMYECCGKAHAIEYQKRLLSHGAWSSDGASAVSPPKCALVDCNNTCHIDDNGKVHECCSFSHAMEHQRRISLMKQDVSQNIVKGVTHCLLPECNNIVWPFQNYCGRTHADIGTQRGLNVTVTSNDDPNACIFPNCTQLKYTEPNGIAHPYCGKRHAELAKSLGIYPTASSTDEQCQLEGCNRPKLREGGRVHDYCSLEHAKKDEPNRQVLTPLAKVKEYLKKFESNLKVVSLEENDHAKPGGALFKKFKDKMMSLPKDQRQTCLAFHGTPSTNIQSICQNGYNSALRRGQAYGPGEYFAKSPGISMGYCGSGKKMLLNELLLGQQGTHHTLHGDVVVMKDPIHDLPRFIITFQ